MVDTLSLTNTKAETVKPRVQPMLEDYSHVVGDMYIGDLIGTPQLGKRGITEEEKEQTSLTEEILLDHFKEFKYVALYFGAENAPPCRLMLQHLKNFYTDINMQKKQMEIIYVPCDKDNGSVKGSEQWKQHYAKMPWLSMPYGTKKKDELLKKFDIKGIPALIVCDAETGITITTNGRRDIGAGDCDVPAVVVSWDKQLILNKRKLIFNAEMQHQFDLNEQTQKDEATAKARAEEERKALATQKAAIAGEVA